MWKTVAGLLEHIPGCRGHRLESLLAEFSRTAAESESPDAIYGALNQLLSSVLDFDRLGIRFVDRDSGLYADTYVMGHRVYLWGEGPSRLISNTVTGLVVETEKPVLIGDCSDGAVLSRFPGLALDAKRLPSFACLPMISSGVTVGTLKLRSSKKHAFSGRSIEILEKIMAHVTPILVNSPHWAVNQRHAREYAALGEIERLTSSVIDFVPVWDELVNLVRKLVSFDRLVLATVDDNGETLSDRFVYGTPVPNWDGNPDRKKIKIPQGGKISGKRSRILSMKENDQVHRDLIGYDMSERTGLKSSMSVMLVAGDRVVGTLNVRSTLDNAYCKRDGLLFEQLAARVSGPVAAAELYSRTTRLAAETQARSSLELENRKLEEMNQTKARFISMVSHELRTPLTSIIAFTDIIGRNSKNALSDRDLMHIDVVKRNGSRLRILIEDLLAMSEIESGDINITKVEFSLQEVIDQLSDSVGPILKAKDQKLVVEYSQDAMTLVSDKIRVEQILSNLVSNASKYSGNDTEIKIKVHSDDEQMRLSVIDRGEGMDADELPSLFDEFSRLDNAVTRANQGSGLGLAISRRLAIALGGNVEVESKPGEGSVFTITLPIELPEAA